MPGLGTHTTIIQRLAQIAVENNDSVVGEFLTDPNLNADWRTYSDPVLPPPPPLGAPAPPPAGAPPAPPRAFPQALLRCARHRGLPCSRGTRFLVRWGRTSSTPCWITAATFKSSWMWS